MDELNLPPLDPQKGSWNEAAISRRRFLELGFWTATGITGLTVGGSGVRFFIGKSLEAKSEQWVKVGDLAELPAGQIHRATYSIRTYDAWQEVEETGLLYCFSEDGRDYLVLDATCTHLGCNVLWQEQGGYFACPCHNGVFDQEGRVISGPPPAPLRRLQTKTENGILMALI